MSSTKRIIIAVVIVLVIGTVVQILFDPLSSAKHTFEVEKARAKFPESQAKWNKAKITDYKFEVRGYAPLACVVSAAIEVRNGVVVQVESIDFIPSVPPPQVLPLEEWATPSLGSQIFLCDYANFTMPQFFDQLAQLLEMDAASILQVDFDPSYGFITYFNFGTFVPKGLLSPRIGDCCSNFRIENFEVLEK